MSAKLDISVVVPVYGCPEALPELYQQLINVLDSMQVSYEIVLIDDCDEMGSWDEIEKISQQDNRVKGIRFTHNCGQDIAITAGIRNAIGNWIITMDCDLQDNPKNIPKLYDKAVNDGVDVVFMRRRAIKASALTRLFARLFHRIFSYYTEIPFDYEIGTYLIASRKAAELYKSSKGCGRDFGMFLMWLRFDHTFLEYDHGDRFSGRSTYTFGKKVNYALRMMISFSNRILYLPVQIGSVAVIGAFAFLIVTLIEYFVFKANPEGWTSLMAIVILFGGLILSTLGIIGVYIGNIVDISKEKPLYVIQESLNCDEEGTI